MNNFDVIIIGAGIIGLATAYELTRGEPSLKVCILEKENSIALHQTGNNSGVIHSGIYYKPGSLKAKNCIEGYKLMTGFCKENNIKYEICGKLIIATRKSELMNLKRLYSRGLENGLSEIKLLDESDITNMEPNVRGIEAIYVPYTGITDYKEVSARLKDLLIKSGVKFHFNSRVKNIKQSEEVITIHTSGSNYFSNYVINCTGLYSDVIASYTMSNIDIRILPFRGEYYYLRIHNKNRISSLIYPVPNPEFPFLGVHITKTINGELEAGPNAVPAFSREGYSKLSIKVNELFKFLTYSGTIRLFRKYWRTGFKEIAMSFSKNAFVKEVKRFMPQLEKGDFSIAPSGVRAQACDKKGNIIDDFIIYDNERVINVCNAPSPAATASLSIGKTIAEKLFKKVNIN